MTGPDCTAELIARIVSKHVSTITGGACAFMIDAVGQASRPRRHLRSERAVRGYGR